MLKIISLELSLGTLMVISTRKKVPRLHFTEYIYTDVVKKTPKLANFTALKFSIKKMGKLINDFSVDKLAPHKISGHLAASFTWYIKLNLTSSRVSISIHKSISHIEKE